jgi:hypothetical protein
VTWEAINLASPEFAQPSEPPSIAGLIYAGKRHVVSGPPESAKSWFSFIVALEHQRTGAGRWAHIDFEIGAVDSRRMLDDLGATLDEIRAVLHYEPEGPPDIQDIDSIVAQGATLAVIDAAAGAYEVSALDDNKRLDAERFAAAWIKPLWSRGIATLVVDHVVKNSDNRGKFSIGSERKIGQSDVHLGLEAITTLSRGTTGLFRVTTHKDRPGHLTRPTAAELELRSDPVTHAISWTFKPASGITDDGDTWRPTVLMERVSEYLATLTEPVNKTVIVRDVRGKREWVIRAIDCLVADGTATETRGAHGAKLITLQPFPPAVPPVESGNRERVPLRSPSQTFPGTPGNGREQGTAQTSLSETDEVKPLSKADLKRIERIEREYNDGKRLP